MMKELEKAAIKAEGRRAYEAGLPITANPYANDDSQASACWRVGWKRAARSLANRSHEPHPKGETR